MVGSLMQHEDIDAVIVGADRVVKNGDTANKVSCYGFWCKSGTMLMGSHQIGTYQAAALAKLHGIPFMVIAPVTTLDMQISHGKEYVTCSQSSPRILIPPVLAFTSNNVHPLKLPWPAVSSSPLPLPSSPPLQTTRRHLRRHHRLSSRSRRTPLERATT